MLDNKLKPSKNFFDENKYKIYFFISIIFLYLQSDFLFIGGTTWDQIGYIRGTGKQIEKGLLTIFDRSNPILDGFDYTEGRGVLLQIPMHLFSRYEAVQNLFGTLVENNIHINSVNNLEIQYILRHLFLLIYFVFINYFIFIKLTKLTTPLYSVLLYLFLCLTPSISGHALFNNTDIPYAFQFLLVSVFYIDYLDNKKKVFNKIPREYLIGLLFGFCLVIRINAIVFFGALSIFHLLYLGRDKILNYDFYVNQIKIYTTAVFVLYLLSPSMWLRPVKWVQFAILDQFRHPNDVQTVVNGVKVTASDTGPFYLLIWLYSKLPIFFIISFFIYLFYFFYRRSTNIFSSFSLFFLAYVQIIFMLLKPPAYDGIRHYLFLIPFIIALSCDILNIYFDRFNLKNTLIYIFIFSYLFYTQYGLGPYRYAYFNEFVNEEEISYICEEALNGCGDWATDYWGFSGKEMYKLSKKYDDEVIYYCSPGEIYTTYIENKEKSPWRLTNGQPDFDDEMVWNQDELIFSRLRFFDMVEKSKGSQFTIYAMTIHRPGNDNCHFNKFTKDQMDYRCDLMEAVTRNLRGKKINLNYLYKCDISVQNY